MFVIICLSLQILQVPGKSPFNTECRTKLYKKHLVYGKSEVLPLMVVHAMLTGPYNIPFGGATLL